MPGEKKRSSEIIAQSLDEFINLLPQTVDYLDAQCAVRRKLGTQRTLIYDLVVIQTTANQTVQVQEIEEIELYKPLNEYNENTLIRLNPLRKKLWLGLQKNQIAKRLDKIKHQFTNLPVYKPLNWNEFVQKAKTATFFGVEKHIYGARQGKDNKIEGSSFELNYVIVLHAKDQEGNTIALYEEGKKTWWNKPMHAYSPQELIEADPLTPYLNTKRLNECQDYIRYLDTYHQLIKNTNDEHHNNKTKIKNRFERKVKRASFSKKRELVAKRKIKLTKEVNEYKQRMSELIDQHIAKTKLETIAASIYYPQSPLDKDLQYNPHGEYIANSKYRYLTNSITSQ